MVPRRLDSQVLCKAVKSEFLFVFFANIYICKNICLRCDEIEACRHVLLASCIDSF